MLLSLPSVIPCRFSLVTSSRKHCEKHHVPAISLRYIYIYTVHAWTERNKGAIVAAACDIERRCCLNNNQSIFFLLTKDSEFFFAQRRRVRSSTHHTFETNEQNLATYNLNSPARDRRANRSHTKHNKQQTFPTKCLYRETRRQTVPPACCEVIVSDV